MITTAEQAAERAAREERERRDWFDMMQNEAAFRVWTRLLREMGIGRLMMNEDDMRMRNVADQILARMADADPEIFLRMTRALHEL